MEIGRAADLNRHIFTATAGAAAVVAVREREREVVRGARARRKRCKEGKQMLRVQEFMYRRRGKFVDLFLRG